MLVLGRASNGMWRGRAFKAVYFPLWGSKIAGLISLRSSAFFGMPEEREPATIGQVGKILHLRLIGAPDARTTFGISCKMRMRVHVV